MEDASFRWFEGNGANTYLHFCTIYYNDNSFFFLFDEVRWLEFKNGCVTTT